MRLEVEVTQEDVDGGTPSAECCCPVAMALRRALDCEVWVGQHQWGTLLSTRWPLYVAPLPAGAQRFIKTFDSQETRGEALPFTFTVEVPGE